MNTHPRSELCPENAHKWVLDLEQWNAALEAARLLAATDPHNADDRARFRTAKAHLANLLPEGADARDIITQAVRWDSLNFIAGAFAGMPAAIGEPQ